MPEGEWVPIGEETELSSSRYDSLDQSFDEKVKQALANKNHLWIVIVTHYASDQTLDRMSGDDSGLPILDHESVAQQPMVGCYICEETFEPRIRNYKCKGMR